MRLLHSAVIAAPPNAIFEACRRVAEWPKFMPAVTSASVIEETADTDVVEICADFNGLLKCWRSRRTFSEQAGEITFVRLNPLAPIDSMHGTWQMIARVDGACDLHLIHQFKGVDAASTYEIEQAIRRNATVDLAALKLFCEGRRA